MKRFLVSIAILSFFAHTAVAQKAQHVVLISIDGLRPDFYLGQQWRTPNLRKLMQDGMYSHGINSVFPSVTYPSHTSIITGASPARHGIFFNAPFGAKGGKWYWEESLIKTATLWDAVRSAGMKSGAVMWPVTVGAPVDYNFPVKRADNDETTDQLSVTAPLVTPANLLNDMQKSFGTLSKEDFNGDNTIDITIGKMARYIISTYKPNLMAIHFITADHQQHGHGRDARPVKVAVERIDSLIGTVIRTVEESGLKNNTAFIITGDHGMVDTKMFFSPNVYLAKAGLINGKEWKAKFNPAGGSAFLYLKDKSDTESLSKVIQILNSLPEDQKRLFRIIGREEMDAVGANTDAVMAIAMEKGVAVNAATEGEAVKDAKPGKANHGYFPDFKEIQTGFIAAGAGISKGVITKEMTIKDIAPLVSVLLGLDFKAPDGILHPEILK